MAGRRIPVAGDGAAGVAWAAVRRAAAAVDILTLVLFVVIGRGSHHHGETVAGFLSTVWPFAVALGAAWVAAARRPPVAITTGALVALVTVAVGMVLRVMAGQGTAAAFVGVALGFNGLLMVGGRLAVRALVRRRPQVTPTR